MKISIVFEETSEAGGHGFNVYLDGMTKQRRQEIDAMTPEEQMLRLSRAEFWALRCFQITIDAMIRSGVVGTAKERT